MKKTHPICDAMTTKFELPTSEHPLKCSERKEGEEETTNTRKKRKTDRKILPHILCVYLWGKNPRHNGTKCSFNILKNLQRAKKKPKTGNDKEAEHVKKYLKCGVSHFLNTFMCRDYKISIWAYETATHWKMRDPKHTKAIFISFHKFVRDRSWKTTKHNNTKKEDEKKQKQDYAVSVFLGSLLLFFSPYGQGR